MSESKWHADTEDVEAIVKGQHADPFGILGLHEVDGTWVARTFIPHADTVRAYDSEGRVIGELTKVHPAGFFEGKVDLYRRQPVHYAARDRKSTRLNSSH